jgi:hypothetical protein
LLQHSRSSISQRHLAPHGRAIHNGTKLTSRDVRFSSAYQAEADMPNIPADFR